MHQEITPSIDDTYTAYSHSVYSILHWYTRNEVAGILAVVSQVIFPVIVTTFVVIFFIFVLELKPHNFGKKIENELRSNVDNIKTNAQARILTYLTSSIVFQALTLAADIAALCQYCKNALPDEVHKYYDSRDSPRYFWSVPITMLLFDSALLGIFLVIVPVISCCRKKYYVLTYCFITPFGCIASHSYHIIFAFIHDPYHATSILLLYAIISFLHIQGFRKFFYCIHAFTSGNSPCCKKCMEWYEKSRECYENWWEFNCHKRYSSNKRCWNCLCCCNRFFCSIYFWTILLYIFIPFVLMGGSIAISLALVIELPISNALDEAPNRLYVIYQASIAFFAGMIAFQLLFRQGNTILSEFVKAVNTSIEDAEKGTKGAEKSIEIKDTENQTSTTLHSVIQLVNKEEWKSMSEKEKEFLVANMVLSRYLNNNASTDDPQPGRGSVRRNLVSDPPRQRHQQPPRQPPQLTQQPEHASSGCNWITSCITSSCCNNRQPLSRQEVEGPQTPPQQPCSQTIHSTSKEESATPSVSDSNSMDVETGYKKDQPNPRSSQETTVAEVHDNEDDDDTSNLVE